MKQVSTQPVSITFMDNGDTESLKVWHTTCGEIVVQMYDEPAMSLDYDSARALMKALAFMLDGVGE